MSRATLISLEMTSPDELVPARPPPAPLELEEVGAGDASLLGPTYARVFARFGGGGRATWSDAHWEEELARDGIRAWLAKAGGEVAVWSSLRLSRTATSGSSSSDSSPSSSAAASAAPS